MKCEHCGGSVILERGILPGEEDKLKCLSCGRYVIEKSAKGEGKKMETEKKTCIKCEKELPKTEEYFNKNSKTKDGFEGQCKICRKKYFDDYRKGKRMRAGASKTAKGKVHIPKRPYHRSDLKKIDSSEPITRATSAEILIALRREIASEIVKTIQEKYEL